ncbi:MAG: hypothetical protein ACE5OO_02625 [Candidatus Bathyarchaeia archaeon]
MATLSLRTLSKPWLVDLSWEELTTLIVCLGLDFIEYIFPALMTPLLGDLLDLAGIVFCGIYFRWIGAVALLELIPGLDVLPNFTITWLVWYVFKRWRAKARLESELERWR